ncbi:MAG TPA: DUF2156 domain-containing protein [Dehalococcoidia bacterium]|nr:DUF2156 domain-containing protein [Dehalococcoidia bacterium]
MSRIESPAERRQRLVDTHGYNGLALLTLYDGWRYFEPAELDGFVAFELHRGTAVACGDPVCAEADVPVLLSLFAAYCTGRDWRFSFVGASARVGKIAAALGMTVVKVGEEPFLDLSHSGLTGNAAKKARSAINLARRTGVTVEEYRDPSPAVDSEITAIARDWLATRNSPPMGFLLRSRPLALREKKRIFIASHDDRIVAVLTCSLAPARGLLYIEEQLRRPDAPYGTSELLIDHARRAARDSGLALLSLGTAPLHNAVQQPYGTFRVLTLLFRALRARANPVYNFASLAHFKKKFAPAFWEDTFLVCQGASPRVALSVIAAFAPEGIAAVMLPRSLRWLRLVPAAALWSAGFAGVLLAGFMAWEFPDALDPARLGIVTMFVARRPAEVMFDWAQVTVLAHRMISLGVMAAAGALFWQRRVRA